MRGVSIFSGIKTAISIASLMFFLGLPAKAHADSQADVEGSLTAAQTTQTVSIDEAVITATGTVSFDSQLATNTAYVDAQSATGAAAMPETTTQAVSLDEFADFRASIDTTYRISGEPRTPNREDLKVWKKYIPAPYFEMIFMKRDMYLIIHTTERCAIGKHGKNKGKLVCLNDKQMLDVLKRNRSAHFMVGYEETSGKCKAYAVVRIEDAANGAGQSVYNGDYAMNPITFHVEVNANVQGAISKTPNIPISRCQYESLKTLTAMIMADHDIPAHRVLGHNQIAVTYKTKTRQRKGDPGLDFDWSAIGLPNNYKLVDPDILAGRARNTSEQFMLKHRLLPGQICAEQVMPEELAKAEQKNNLGNIANVSYCPANTETAMNSLARFLTFNF